MEVSGIRKVPPEQGFFQVGENQRLTLVSSVGREPNNKAQLFGASFLLLEAFFKIICKRPPTKNPTDVGFLFSGGE